MVDINQLVPRTQPDRYSHAILEQLIKLNENIEKLVPKQETLIQDEKPKKPKKKTD
jgi:hypothetical protein